MNMPDEIRVLVAIVFFVALCGVATQSNADEESADDEIKIFSLEYAYSPRMEALIQNLMGSDQLRMEADERTNSLICRGPSSVLSEIEAVLIKLDQPAEDKTVQGTPNKATSKKSNLKGNSIAALAIRSPASGSIGLMVANGAKVQKGDVLAVIEPKPSSRVQLQQKTAAEANARADELNRDRDLELDLDLAKKSQEIALMKLNFAKAQAETEIAASEAELSVAAARAAALQDRAKIIGEQFGSGTASQEDVLMATLEVEEAKGALEVLKLKLALHKDHAMPLEIAAAELELVESQHHLHRVKREQAELDRLRKSEAAATEALKKLQDDQAKRAKRKEIFAPATGLVHYHGKLKKGALVRENQTLFELVPAKADTSLPAKTP